MMSANKKNKDNSPLKKQRKSIRPPSNERSKKYLTIYSEQFIGITVLIFLFVKIYIYFRGIWKS